MLQMIQPILRKHQSKISISLDLRYLSLWLMSGQMLFTIAGAQLEQE